MPPRCVKCLTTLMPDATVCPNCGRPAPPKSALTQQRDMDKTQFIRLAPGELLPEDELLSEDEPPPAPAAPRPLSRSAPVPPSPLPPSPLPLSMVSRRSLFIAVFLGLLAGAFLIFVMVGLTRARH